MIFIHHVIMEVFNLYSIVDLVVTDTLKLST